MTVKTEKTESFQMLLADVMMELYPSDDDGLVENMEDIEKLQFAYEDLMRRIAKFYVENYDVIDRRGNYRAGGSNG